MKGWRYQSALYALILLLAGAWPCAADHKPAAAGKPEHPHPAQPPPKPLSPAHEYFPDVVLVNQDGQKMRLYSDLLKGKVVVINSFFTGCEGSCPVVAGTFAKIQEWLGDRLNKDVHLLSVSVDPEADTPAKLKAYADKLRAKPGWHFLTGPKRHVDWALYKLGHYVEAKEEHRNVIIVGNESTGL